MAGLDPVYALYASRSLGFLLHNSNLAFELDNLCLHPSHAFPISTCHCLVCARLCCEPIPSDACSECLFNCCRFSWPVGGGIIFTALIQFRRHKTTAHPLNFANTTVLLASGVFSLSRNPIYLGMLILMLSLALACADLLSFVPGIIFWLWINYWQIAAEENHLQRHFGAAYVEYCKQVRRWL